MRVGGNLPEGRPHRVGGSTERGLALIEDGDGVVEVAAGTEPVEVADLVAPHQRPGQRHQVERPLVIVRRGEPDGRAQVLDGGVDVRKAVV